MTRTLHRTIQNVIRSRDRAWRQEIASMPRRQCLSSESGQGRVVGFVGLGNMGFPMALNLQSHDVKVVGFDCDETASGRAREKGLDVVGSLEDIAQMPTDLVVTMLPGCDEVHQTHKVLFESVSGDQCPKLLIDCSTVSPTTSRFWHDKWRQRQSTFLDAPVSGGVHGATAGTLTFMVGGCSPDENPEVWHDVQRFLDGMGQRVWSCGPTAGSGAATKLCNNLALAAQMVGICEALNLAESLGVDPVQVTQVLNSSTAKCWSTLVNPPHPAVAEAAFVAANKATSTTTTNPPPLAPPAARGYEGGFGAQLMKKDLALALQVASEHHVALPLTTTSQQLYDLVIQEGLGERDFGVLLQFLKENAGLFNQEDTDLEREEAHLKSG